MKIEKTYKKDSNVTEITGEDLEKHAKETGTPLPRGLKEWKKPVRRCDCDSRILKKLEELGYELRFADSGTYVDCENKRGKYETFQVRALTLEGKVMEGICGGRTKEYPVYIRNAEIVKQDKYYRIYLRIFNNKL